MTTVEHVAPPEIPTLIIFSMASGIKLFEIGPSMILHELFFYGLGHQSEPGPALRDALTDDQETVAEVSC